MPRIQVDRALTERTVCISTIPIGDTFRVPELPGVTYLKTTVIGTSPNYAVRLNGEHAGKIEPLSFDRQVMAVEATMSVKDA